MFSLSLSGNKQGSRSARLSPQSMTWDECKVYKTGVGAQHVQYSARRSIDEHNNDYMMNWPWPYFCNENNQITQLPIAVKKCDYCTQIWDISEDPL